MKKLEGKHAVVTGAARGIGFSIAKRLVEQGCFVSLWDVDSPALEEAKERLIAFSPKIRTRICNVTSPTDVHQTAQKDLSDFGSVEILINNAGYLAPGNFLDQPTEQWIRTLEVNVHGLIHTIHEFLPHMYERNEGHIVNISSAAGLLGVPGLAVYSASKWAVWGLTEALRQETWNLGKRGVRFSSIHPSYVATGLFAGAKLTGIGSLIVPRLSSHDVVAKAVVVDALGKGRHCPKRPRSVRSALVFRALLPDFLFQHLLRVLGVHASMSTWKGYSNDSFK
ncbi:MAG: SDR family NAD(P)-dependent oxidoreductase [Spirochaetes bacterium]|nr:SDR family NAD(P)-dependent oxidoreductase [Spirochaetota bacterium]